MWLLIRQSELWYATKVDKKDVGKLAVEHAVQGTVCIFADDLEWACSEMGVKIDDVKVITE